jgi:arylsulfate sulfotransferase
MAGADPATGSTLRTLSVSSGSLLPSFDPMVTDYAVTSLNGLYPIEVTATTGRPSDLLTVHGAAAQSGVASSFTLKPGEDFAVTVAPSGGTPSTYTVHYLPPAMPHYAVSSSPEAGPEDILLTPDNSYLLIVDRGGTPLYYRTFLPLRAQNFQQHRLPSGAIVYSASVGTSATAWTLGSIRLMDASFHDIGDLQLLPNGSHGLLPAESHDFMLLDDDHYVAMTYVERRANLAAYNRSWGSSAPVMNAIVQEVDHGDVLFEWDSANEPSLYTDSVDGNAFTNTAVSDYLHLNSIEIDPEDNNFIFSLRHTNSIVKVDRLTTKILWTLGGLEDEFGLTSDQVFSHQHDVRKHLDGSLSVFDNGNNLHQTRIISFVLDEENKKVLSFRVIYPKLEDQPQTSFMGSQRSGSGTREIFGWGGWNTNDIAPSATEVLDGKVVWQLAFTAPQVFSYRALPVDTQYRLAP